MTKRIKKVVAVLVCLSMIFSMMITTVSATESNTTVYGQTFEGITDVTTAVPSNNPNVRL